VWLAAIQQVPATGIGHVALDVADTLASAPGAYMLTIAGMILTPLVICLVFV